MTSRASLVRIVLATAIVALCAPPPDAAATNVRMAAVDQGDFGNQSRRLFETGDLTGSYDVVLPETFDALTPAQLRASYDVLLIGSSDPPVDRDWTTRLAPFLELGGNILVEFALNGLPPAVIASAGGTPGPVILSGSVPVLTEGLAPVLDELWYVTSFFASWDDALHPFLAQQGNPVGLYGTWTGGGRIIVTTTLPSFSANPDADNSQRAGYRFLLHGVRWLARLCESGPDVDDDGIVDTCDACPLASDPLQEDADQDGVGDACDACAADDSGYDGDGDGFCSNPARCPAGCDNCPSYLNPTQSDGDGDGFGDFCDNCRQIANPDQADRGFDYIGDACDDCRNCDPDNEDACTQGCVDEGSGQCVRRPLPDGSPCYDGNQCTDEQCVSGACVATPHVCEQPANPCYEATCGVDGTGSGCSVAPRANGAACDDGNSCTAEDRCTFGACSGDPIAACAADTLKCYGATGGTRSNERISYDDRFATAALELVQTDLACHPATDGAPPFDDTRHLSCARVRVPSGVSFARRSLRLTDRFGTADLRLGRPVSYCAPSAVPGDPATLPLDELACYRVSSGAGANRELVLQDARGTRTTKILRPHTVCVPAQRAGAAIVDAKRLVTCYRARDAEGSSPPPESIALDSALSSERLKLHGTKLVCVPSTIEPCARVTFASSGSAYTGSNFCGGPAFDPPAAPPWVGGVYDATSGGNLLHELGNGCVYFGGGANVVYPGTPNPAGASYELEAASCTSPVLELEATGSPAVAECARGPASFDICYSDPQHRSCTSDGDCPGSVPGRCGPAPRCFAGPPQPFRSLAYVCLLTPVDRDVAATVNPDTGEMELRTSARTLAYLTGNGVDTCPQCVAGVCSSGSRRGRPCRESTTPDLSTHDCPPRPDQLFLVLGPGETLSSTSPTTLTAADGRFCDGQRTPGAFGDPRVRRIELSHGAAGSLRDGLPHVASLLSGGCSPASGNAGADQLSDLPGPVAGSVAGTLQLLE